MSAIRFLTPTTMVEVSGDEFVRLGSIARDIALAILMRDGLRARDQLAPFMRGAESLVRLDDEAWREELPLWFDRPGRGVGFRYGGRHITVPDLSFNTEIAVGSPAVVLAAQIRGRCERWAFVNGQDASWFADAIEEGIGEEILLAAGWDDVVSLARRVANGVEGPIVIGYSATASFPNAGIARWPEIGDGRPWEELSLEQQWELAMRRLRRRRDNGRLSADRLRLRVRIGGGFSAFDLVGYRHVDAFEQICCARIARG